jgi:hypothetical protein
MRFLAKLVIISICPIVLACNPLAPTDYELVHGVTATPSSVTLHLGQQQSFTVNSNRGHLDDMWFGVTSVYIDDPECRCKKDIPLGKLKRLEQGQLIFYAPLRVDSVPLPATVKIYVGAGDWGRVVLNDYRDIAEITITP